MVGKYEVQNFFHREAKNFQAILALFQDNMLYFRSVVVEEYVVFVDNQAEFSEMLQARTGLCATVPWHVGPYWDIKWALDNCCLISRLSGSTKQK